MKNLFLTITILLSAQIYAQEVNTQNTLFVRVYNLEGAKMNKGKVLTANDTILPLKRGLFF